jgi:lipopolysaccharide transport system permease protein
MAMILVYTLIFSEIMQSKLPGIDGHFSYSIYLCGGIFTWGLFTEIINRSLTMFLENGNLLKKISFPRSCLPVIVVTSALLNFGIAFALFTIFLLLTGTFPGWPYFALLPLIILLIAFAIGLGVLLGTLNVFFRDIGQFFGIFLTFWFWLTPIVYPSSILPAKLSFITALNPLSGFMTAVQEILVQGIWPQWDLLIYPFVLTIFVCILAARLFRSSIGEMVDEL